MQIGQIKATSGSGNRKALLYRQQRKITTEKGQAIPFGPYLAIAGLITFFYGDAIVNFYWQLIL